MKSGLWRSKFFHYGGCGEHGGHRGLLFVFAEKLILWGVILVDSIKDLFDQIPLLREEGPDSGVFKEWQRNVEKALRENEGFESSSLKTFKEFRFKELIFGSFEGRRETERDHELYQKGLDKSEYLLKSILESGRSDKRTQEIWDLMHPKIVAISKKRFEDGHFADSVEAAFKEINSKVKEIVKNKTGQEFDGASLLMFKIDEGKLSESVQ